VEEQANDIAIEDSAAESSKRVWDESELSHEEWEEHREYVPVWKGRSHGFHDLGKAASQEAVDIPDKHLPRSIDWHCEANQYHFRCDGLDIVIDVSSDEQYFFLPPEIINRKFAVSRARIDPLRDRLRVIAHYEGRQLTRFRDFAMVVLRILEEVCRTLEEWSATDQPPQIVSAKTGKRVRVAQATKTAGVQSGLFQLEKFLTGNLNSVDQSAHALFGLDLKQICDNIPSIWKV